MRFPGSRAVKRLLHGCPSEVRKSTLASTVSWKRKTMNLGQGGVTIPKSDHFDKFCVNLHSCDTHTQLKDIHDG